MKPAPFFRALSRALARSGHLTAARWIAEWGAITRCPPRDLRAILENLTAGEVEALLAAWRRGIAAMRERGA